MPVFNNALAGAAGSGGDAGYKIERSLRFNSGNSDDLSKTFSSAGNRRTWTFSAWIKFADVTGNSGIFECTYPGSGSGLKDTTVEVWYTAGQIHITDYSNYYFSSAARLRDPNAWGHLVIRLDTTEATQANRIRLYWNGEQLVNSVTPNINQNDELGVNGAAAHKIGNWRNSTYSNLYFAEIHHVDGQSLDPTSFAEADADTGVWNPIKYSGSYGTNGFKLDFSDNSSNAALGTDSSGNSNDWTVSSNIVAEKVLTLPGVSFDGAGDHIECADDTDFTFGSNDFTIEFFVKPKSFSGFGSLVQKYNGVQNTSTIWMATDTSGDVSFYVYYGSGDASTITSSTSLTLNKWSHVACVRDGTTLRLYIDGVQRGSSTTIGSSAAIDSSTPLRIGEDSQGNYDFHGVISNVRIVNGTCLYTNGTAFTVPTAPLTNVTNTKLLCCQSSTSVTAAAVTPNNLTTGGNPVATEQSDSSGDNDSLIDSPTNYEASSGNNGGNYCTWNPLVVTTNNSLSNGNLEASHTASTGWTGNTGASGYPMFVGNMGVTSGKYYWEGSFTSATVGAIGVVNKPQGHLYYVGYADTTAKSAGYSTTYVYNNGFGAAVGSLPAITQNDIIGVAIDMDNGKLYFSLNGTFINSGDPIAGTGFVASGLDGETIFPAISHLGSNDGYSFTANFGARPFVYTPPTGFKSLCTTNLDDPLIADGSDYFDVKTWDGTGAENTLTGFEFSPDMIWVKRRNNSTDWHNITDTVRGATNTLYPNDQYVDTVSSQNVKAFTSDGVTLGTFGGVNASGGTYVGWTWDAGNSNTTISAGSLNSSAYNTSQDWYTAGTETGSWPGSYDWQGVFESSDITTTNAGESMATSGTSKFTFGTAVAASSNVTILSYQNVTATFKVNAGEADETSIAVPTNTGVSEHVITFNGDVKNIQIESSGQYVYVTGVKIDGKLLVQPSGTMVNVPAFASTVRANQTAGFSIVSYTGNNTTGATVAHGLNTTPSWIIIKNRSTAYNWIVLYTDTSKKLYLDLTNTPDAYSQTTRNSSYFTLENGTAVNGSGDDMIAYCFAPVEGYSAFGSYTGNGSADGPFVYTGFKPAFLMLKRTDGAAGWYIYDYKRDGYNAANKLLYANVTNAEANNHIPDFLSNGFQIKTTGTVANGNGNSYIYAAFAENPFKTARAR